MGRKFKKSAKSPDPQNGPSVFSGLSNHDETDVFSRLDVLREVPARDSSAAADSLAKILATARTIKRPVSFSTDGRLKNRQTSGKGFFFPIQKRVSMKTIGIIGLVLALTFGGGMTTVQASQGSLPNELLYPVKLLSEDVQLSLTQDPLRDLELLMAFTEARGEEITAILETGEELPDTVVDRLDLHYQMALEYAASLTDAELLVALQQMNQQLETQLQLFQQIQIRSENQNQMNLQLEKSMRVIERNRVMVTGSMEDPVSLRERMGTERPETAPVQPDNVPGQGSGDRSGSGQGAGGEGSGAGTGSGGSGKGDGNGQGMGADGSEFDPEAIGTFLPGQSGQGGPGNGH
ncbi:MAG: hypothetical protein JXA25_12520 [Anaerolineales bacterium]|nr:hypothetical protein [Anaerolineales bacterium]